MKTSNNTILITGGSAGIGCEIAKLFSADNKIIITGRNEQRLKATAAKLANTTAIVGDVSNAADVDRLVKTLNTEHPDLNIVINNAGHAYTYNLATENPGAFEKASEEMLVNYLSIIRLNEKLLPLVSKKTEGRTEDIYRLYLSSPEKAIQAANPIFFQS
jgi:uncharacterized oxidoreductase